jgi:hypothetical protein
MKAMRKVSRGKSFRGALDYVFFRDDAARLAGKKSGILIGGNMSGNNPRSLANEFGVTRRVVTKRTIEKPVWHQSLRLPANEKESHTQWNHICNEYMTSLGFTEMHMRSYILHDDKDGQHVHIVASRIGLNGNVYLGQNENLKTTAIVRELEKKYRLSLTPEKNREKAQPSKNELEKAVRTGQRPPKMILQDTIDQILTTGPITAPDFVSLLAAHGIRARPNIALTGKFSGFSFSLDGDFNKNGQSIGYKGSSLGKNYTAASLLTRGLLYDPHRDMPIFTGGHHPEPAADYNGKPKIRYRNGGREFSLIIFMRYESFPGGQLYRWQSGAPAFIDHGAEITCAGKTTSAKIRGMLDLAREKGWSRIELSGPREFQTAAAMEAARRGISVSGGNKEIQEIWRQEHERTASERTRKPQLRSNRHNTSGSATAPGCGLRGLPKCTLVPLGERSGLLLQTTTRDRMGQLVEDPGDLGLRREGVIDGIKARPGSTTATNLKATYTAGTRADTTGNTRTEAGDSRDQDSHRNFLHPDPPYSGTADTGDHRSLAVEPEGIQNSLVGTDPEVHPRRYCPDNGEDYTERNRG